MLKKTFRNIQKFYFVGIGGIGMCGIAELLADWGYQVSGSDILASENTRKLESLGINVFIGHRRENITDCDVLVYSSAVHADNPEIAVAREQKIMVIRRAEMLGEIFKLKPIRIAVSGTHGKTTTTSMIGQIFSEAGRDPIIIAGGIINALGSTTRSGKGDVIIVEADEFDRSFLDLSPTDAIITAIEAEHLDCYSSLEEIEFTFVRFANQVPFFGSIVACIDEPSILNILPRLEKPVITYGINSEDAEITPANIELKELKSSFDVVARHQTIGHIELSVPGIHNVKNALAAVAVALQNDIDFSAISAGLSQFRGVRRRFEIIEDNNDYMLVDDYGHHPTEIKATLAAAKNGWNRRVIAIFQPHLYTRTRDFYQQFGEALQAADEAIVLDVYPAREKPIEGITGKLIVDAAIKLGYHSVYYASDKTQVPKIINRIARRGDIIITLGAGDVNQLHSEIKTLLSNKFKKRG